MNDGGSITMEVKRVSDSRGVVGNTENKKKTSGAHVRRKKPNHTVDLCTCAL